MKGREVDSLLRLKDVGNDSSRIFTVSRTSEERGTTVSAITDAFLMWWLRSGRYGWSRLRRRLFEGRYLRTPLPAAGSLEEIEALLRQVTWTMDGPLHLFDCISYPQVTWAKKKDDCDGFASLAAALLHRWDPNCSPVLVTAMLRPVQESHTVCVFHAPQGGLSYFDNSTLVGGCQTYGDVITQISQRGRRVIGWDVRDPSTLEMIEFHRV